MSDQVVLVSWVSVNHDPYPRAPDGSYREPDGARRAGPTLEALFGQGSPLRGHVGRVCLLLRSPTNPEPGARNVHPREEDVFEEVRREARKMDEGLEVEAIPWRTDASPIDHVAVFRFTAGALWEIRRRHPKAQIAVNLSPGTPAMHAALLLALQARVAGDRVRAFQGAPFEKRRRPEDSFQEVPWNLLERLSDAPTPGPVPAHGEWTLANARSPRLVEVVAQVNRYAGVPFPVLITGRRGTGKSDVAARLRALHREWQVAAPTDWTFRLNCAEFQGDPSMLRSELFGHEKGSFTGASASKTGLLERASNDCVLLDEIHWMDPKVQAILLVALQRDGRFRRIGGESDIPARFRLLAATNRGLSELRETIAPDLLDRISDLRIHLPELHECREDLGLFWRSVVRRACEEFCSRDPSRAGAGPNAGASALAAQFQPHETFVVKELIELRLPGNLRDLERLARRVITAALHKSRFAAVSRPLVAREVEQLRREEGEGERQGARRRSSLADELPAPHQCQEHLRRLNAEGRTEDGRHLVNEWERRLLAAARAVMGSGNLAAQLLRIPSRTFNNRLKILDAETVERSSDS